MMTPVPAECILTLYHRFVITHTHCTIRLITSISMKALTLEECLEFIDDDELLEITPKNLRMRKRVLEVEMRKKLAARARRGEA